MKPALPSNEAQRLQALYQLQILDSLHEPAFEALNRLACLICNAPTSALSLIDIDRQWFKSSINIDVPQTPREDAFCAHAILTPGQLTYVPDTYNDPRFADHPAVQRENGIRFYAGAPLRINDDIALGTLCVVDSVPRELTPEQLEALRLLSAQAVTLMQNRLIAINSLEQQQTLRTVTENVPVLIGQVDREFRYVFCNQKYADWFGIDTQAAIGRSIAEVFGQESFDELEPSLHKVLQGQQIDFVAQPRAGRVFNICFVPQKSPNGRYEHIIIVASDITDNHQQQQKTQHERDRLDAIIQGTNLGTWEWNIATGRTYYNHRWFSMLGMPPDKHTTIQLWETLIHPDDYPTSVLMLQQHFRGELPFYDVKFRMKHSSGHWVWIHAVGRVTSWNEQGEPELMFGTHTDISTDMAKEAEILSTRSWLQAVIDSSSEVAMISTDIHGVIQLFNTGAERMLGYKAEELIGLQSPAVFHNPDEIVRRSAQLTAEYKQDIQGFDAFVFRARQGISETRQWTYICKNGEQKQVRLSVSVMRNDDGSVLGYLGVAIDITQLEQLHHALLLSEQRHRSMLENLPGVVYRCINDEHWTMLFISDEVEKLTGYPAKNFIRNKITTFTKITHPDDTEQNRDIVERELANHARFSTEYRIMHANGSVRWVQELGRGIFDQNNQLLYIDGFIWDITAQKEAMLGLRASEQKLSSLYQLAPLAIALTKYPGGNFVEANPEFGRMLGYDRQHIDQMSFANIVPVRQQQCIQQEFERLATTGRYGPVETELRHRDGHLVPVVQSGVQIESISGQLQTWSIIQDITEHKRIEQMKTQFVSMVSHELRTPLTAISGALGLMAGGALGQVPVPMQTMLNIAVDNSNKLSQLINDLLDIDKLVAGKMQFDFTSCSMLDLLKQSIEHNQPYADKYQATIDLHASDDAAVLLDPMRFHQIMANLLSNAAKFAPTGAKITVALEQTNTEVLVSVQDQGPGISEEFQHRMFEKFSQADSADARSKDGTGLGLAIVKELTERMDGKISFETSATTGTCFRLHFQKQSNEPIQLGNTILVVEDDPSIAGFIRALLESSGYLVTTAHSLASARRAMALRSFSAMTLDLNLPDGHAAALINELRANAATANLPILVISVEKQQDGHRFSGFTAFDWLEKPITAPQLLSSLQKLLTSPRPKILHVEDDLTFSTLLNHFTQDNADIVHVSKVQQATQLLQAETFDLVVLDLGLPDGSGWDLLPLIAEHHQHLPVLIWSADELSDELKTKVDAVLSKNQQAIPHLLSTISRLLKR
ncbi:PAS domain S-box protein [Rheinheimera sp. SA_1]|uniref:PAS domain S-box protein n=1 Tax=Rheinheimera sp. SA_1 TaxID=1827365 RepID=UPI000B0BA135|nr:PAS domain S-box protein [Rheinheimera sp. SA_1]